MRFNPSQTEAIQHRGGPLLIVAGAGSGKTATLVGRVASLVSEGVDPDRILMLTFTNKAAKSMIARAGKALKEKGWEADPLLGDKEICAGTFHSIGYQFLHRFGTPAGYFRGQHVLGEYQTTRIWEKIYFSIPKDRRKWLYRFKLGNAYELSSWFSQFVTGPWNGDLDEFIRNQPLAQKWEEIFPGVLAKSFQAYREFKKELHGFDFDDILITAAGMLEQPQILKQVRQKFDHILVDEYQDTSALQARFLQLISPEGNNLVVVGDPKQSIYAFLNAEVTNITRFHEVYPSARVLPLLSNYRSNEAILQFANHILEGNEEVENLHLQATKDFGIKPHIHKYGSDRMEARGMIRDIKDALVANIPPSEIAVLTRISSITYHLERELLEAGIPYVKVGGLKLLNKRNIRQFIAFLELSLSRFNWLAWETILPMVPLIGEELAQVIIGDMRKMPEWDWDSPPPVSLGSGKRWHSFRKFWKQMSQVKDLGTLDLHQAVQQAFKIFTPIYQDYWSIASDEEKRDNKFSEESEEESAESDTLESRLQEIHEYIVEMTTSRGDYLATFLDKFKLDDSLNQQKHEEKITLSTIHSAKGLEWDVVLIGGVEEGTLPISGRTYGTPRNVMPSDNEQEEEVPEISPWQEEAYIEEERRLFYVACTRAREKLHISYCSQRRGMGRKDSRFLKHLKPPGATSGTVEGPRSTFTLEKMRTDEEIASHARNHPDQ
jgi:DNA helicase-2/ATP-dependent DNA helicase PcrA